MERVKKAIEEGRVQFGVKQSLEAMKNKTAELVVVAKDSPALKSAQYYQQQYGVEILIQENSKALSTFCKKPFRISMLAVINKTKDASTVPKDAK